MLSDQIRTRGMESREMISTVYIIGMDALTNVEEASEELAREVDEVETFVVRSPGKTDALIFHRSHRLVKDFPSNTGEFKSSHRGESSTLGCGSMTTSVSRRLSG